MFFREPPAFSHSVWPSQRKNAPCRDNKGYLKCDTVFQRMGGGGKKRRERGIVERRYEGEGGEGGGRFFPNVLKHTHTRIGSVGSSHGKMFEGRCRSHGWSSQLDTGDLIQIVVSQVRGSVGTEKKSKRGARTASLFPFENVVFSNSM